MNKSPAATILVVEDDAGFRRSVVAFLEDSGFQTVEAPDGIAGFEAFVRDQPDLVISDLRMPGMGGMELLARILEVNPDALVVIVSGTADQTFLAGTLEQGASGFVTKPIADLASLEALLRRLLSKGQP